MNTIKVSGTGDTDSRVAALEQAVNYGEVILPFPVVGEETTGSSGGPPTGPAGGDLTGTYPNPTIGPGAVGNAEISDVAYSKVTGAPTIPTTLPPSGPAGGDLAGTYPNPTLHISGVNPGIYGDATHIPTLDVRGDGRIYGATETALPTTLPPSGPAGGDLSGSYPAPQIAAGVIVDADVNAAAAIQGTKLADAPNGIPTAKLNDGAVTNVKVASGLDAAKITTGTLAQARLPVSPSGLLTANLNDSQVTDAKIAGMAYSKLTGAPTSLPPSGSATGDLTGSYPSPTIAKLNGAAVGTTTPLARGDLLVADATPALKRLALGTASQVLQSNGTDVLWGASLGGPPSGAAGGDLRGTYPNPTCVRASWAATGITPPAVMAAGAPGPLVLQSPDGTQWALRIANDGTLSAERV